MTVPEHAVHYLEIVTPDVAAACRIYGEAFGLRFQGPVAELGNARVAELPGGTRLGIRAPMHPSEQPVVRPYLRVRDVAVAVAAAAERGGEIALEPTELPGHGRIAIYLQGGNQHGLWQVS